MTNAEKLIPRLPLELSFEEAAVLIRAARTESERRREANCASPRLESLLGRLELLRGRLTDVPPLRLDDLVRHRDANPEDSSAVGLIAAIDVATGTVTVEHSGPFGIGTETTDGVSPADLVLV